MLKTLCMAMLIQSAMPKTDSVELVNSTQILEQAIELRNEEKYQEAIDLLLKVSKADTNYYEVQADLLSTYNSAGQYEKSIETGARLIKEPNPYRADMYISYANAYLASEDLEKARKYYQEALEKYPYEYVLMYNMGIAHYRAGEYREAVEYFQRNVRLNPFYANSHLMLGYISILEGNRTRALFSYLTYLMLNPSNNGALVTLENLVNNALRDEGSIEKLTSNSNFEYYDNLLRSKAAFDKRFVQKVDFNASIVKQIELLLSKLKAIDEKEDFWVNFYLPIFTEIERQGYTEAFTYYILNSTKDENVLKWFKKNERLKDEWLSLVREKFYDFRKANITEVGGIRDKYSFWYYNSNDLSAIGNQLSDEHRTGPWVFFYDNGEKSTEGTYTQAGKKAGTWNYFHDDGTLSRTEKYDDEGNIVEPVHYYRKDGSLSIIAHYSGTDLDGFVEYYYDCGQLKEKNPYKMGVNEGVGAYFYETGEKKIDYTLKDGELEGDYIIYYKNGQVNNHYKYVKGKLNGAYVSYYHNGAVDEKGEYVDNLAEGIWEGYHDNGLLSYKGKLTGDKKVGEWIYYYPNGKVKLSEIHNEEGELDGLSKSYHDEGFLKYMYVYAKGVMVNYEFYDKEGVVLAKAENPEGNMPFDSYYWAGGLKSKGILERGKLAGPFNKYYHGGQLWQEGTMKEGNWDGQYTKYYRTGEIAVQCNYDENGIHGYYQSFYRNGEKSSEGHYLNNTAEQLWYEYYPDGSLKEESFFTDGKYDGKVISYSVDGKLWSEMEYDKGTLISYVQYDTAGQVLHRDTLPLGSGLFTYKYTNGQNSFESDLVCGYYVSDNIRYYPNGNILSKTEMKNSELEGEYKYFNESGELLAEGKYANSNRFGLWKFYDSDGKLEVQNPYKDDLLDGEVVHYYENGETEVRSTYKAGERHGPSSSYDPSGNLQVTKYYDEEMGFYGYQFQKSEDELSDTIFLNDKTGDFQMVASYPNGKKACIQEFKNGQFHGANSYYSKDGTLLERIEYKNGENNGIHEKYYVNGTLKYKANYKDDLLDGTEYQYYPNGTVRKSTTYKFGKENGYQKSYSPKGKLTSTRYYWNGMIYE